MTQYLIRIYSKDKKSLHYFLKFFKRHNQIQNSQQLFHLLKKKKMKKKITVLKSPHVNKTAQEQFSYTVHSVDMFCCSLEIKKFLIFLKKTRNELFPSVKIKINGTFVRTKELFTEKLLDPDKTTFYVNKPFWSTQTMKSKLLNVNTPSFKNDGLLKKTLFYLKYLDSYGSFK